MTIKPFAIQGADLTLGGVSLQAGTTGVVIPGVTQATSYVPEEVEDSGDQTHPFNSIPVVIDHTYYSILNGDYIPSNGGGYVEAEYAVTELDDDDFIDGIEIVSQGSGWNLSSANGAKNNDMWAYIGLEENPFATFVGTDWIQIPFRVAIQVGEVETIGGGGSVDGLQGNTNYQPEGEGDVRYSLDFNEDITLTVYQSDSGPDNLGPGISLGKNIDAEHRSGVIAIGNDDVGYNSKQGGIYIGAQAGWFADEGQPGAQGEFAIAIGTAAAYNFAPDNSITLNATGNELNPTSSGLFIKPIREEAYDDYTIYYDPTSGELTYAATTGGGSSLAPELTKANGGILANTTITFGESNQGLIAVVDSGGNDGQWFNFSVGDADGAMYACGTNDAGPQYVWAFNPDGTVKWKVGIDQIDGYDVVPRTLAIDGDYLIVGTTYDTNTTTEREIGVVVLSLLDGTSPSSYTKSTSTVGSKRIRAFAIGPEGSHFIAGSLYGEAIIDNNITPNRETWGSKVNVLTVANSSLSSPVVPWNYNLEVQNDPLDANAWYSPNNINYFSDLTVTTMTGTGGPQTYNDITDYVAGQLQLVVGGTGTTWFLRLDATWANGSAQTHLLAQTGTYSYTIICFPGTFVTGQTTAWSDVGGGIYEAGLSVNGVIADGTYDITSLVIEKSVMSVELRYVPAGLNNSGLTGGMIDSYNVQNQGQGYAAGDIVKVLGSQMGGVDTITLTGTSNLNTSANNLFFLAADYPGFSVVQNGWRASGPGITDWVTLSNVQLAGGTLWRFDVPEGITLQAGETYTLDNNGNDITLTLADWGGGPYINYATGKVADQVAATTRIVMSQGVDYRGLPNSNLYSVGSEYTVGQVAFSSNASTAPWFLMIHNSLTTINSLLNEGTALTLTLGGTNISTTIITDAVDNGDGYQTYVVDDLSGFGTSGTDLDSIRVFLGTYTGTWNLRQSLNQQAFILADGWSHTYGGSDYEQFSSIVYDSFDNSIYALGEFYNGTNGVALFKFDTTTGDTTWVKYVEDDTGNANDAGTVAVDGTGNVYTCATNDSGDTIVTKLTSTGTLVWQVVQNNSDDWNNQPSMVLDSNGDIIVGGSYYNRNDPIDNHNLWSFMKLSKTDGSLIWARYLDNQEKYNMYDMEDYDIQPMSVQGDDIYYAGQAYDENDSYYVALSFKFNTNGAGLGTYGRWIWSEDENAVWTDNTSNAVVITATIPEVDQTTFTSNTDTISVTADEVGTVTPTGYVLGGNGKLVFVDGSELTSAGIARHSVDNGDTTIWLNASMNGKFRYYADNPSQFNSTIRVPTNANTPLPVGFTLTVVMGDFGNCRIYVNNDGNSDVQFIVSGNDSFGTNYWQFNASTSAAGVYTIMKVDTDTWLLSGPDVTID